MIADASVARRAAIHAAAKRSLNRRRMYNGVWVGICWIAVIAAAAPIVSVLEYTIRQGLPAWTIDFFTQLPTPAGIPGGGIANAIVGSLIIDGIAAVAAIPVGIALAFFLAEQRGPFGDAVRFGADVLAGVPSIVIGIFAYAVLVTTLGHFSAISASFALAVLMLPIVMRGTEGAIRTVSTEMWEGGAALGVARVVIALRVILPAALPGVVTACLLGICRMVGESAPLLFTAIGNQYWAFSPTQPMASMPLIIYLDGIQAYPDLQRTAWGTALLLVVFVGVVSSLSRVVARRFGGLR